MSVVLSKIETLTIVRKYATALTIVKWDFFEF